MRVERALRLGAGRLRSGSGTPFLDAEVLLGHAVGCSRVHLAAYPEQRLTRQQQLRFRSLLSSRQRGLPVAYLTGRKEFCGLSFRVNRRVMIPRPETEAVVEAVQRRLPPGWSGTIADIGTGCGALAITLAQLYPAATVYGVDRAAAALAVARRNAACLGAKVHFRRGHLLLPLTGMPLDVVVANLPYLPDGGRAAAAESLRFEPVGAFWSGADGLRHYRQLIEQLRRRRQRPALVVCEMLPAQAVKFSAEVRQRWPSVRLSLTVVNGVAIIELTNSRK